MVMRNEQICEVSACLKTALTCFVVLSAITLPAIAEESTAYVDLRLLFERSWKEIYDNPLAVEVLQTRINQIKDEEKETLNVRNWIVEFAGRGFHRADYEYCLFKNKNDRVREAFLTVVQKTGYHLTSNFLKDIYRDYQSTPDTMAFDVLIEPSWIRFSESVADESAHQALMQTLNSPAISQQTDRYFMMLYYGYQAYPEKVSDFDNEVKAKYIDSKELTPAEIDQIYQTLNKNYWNNLTAKKDWMLTKTAWRLFTDFSPKAWAGMKQDNVLALARILSKAQPGDGYNSVDITQWMIKIGEGIKGNPADSSLRTLLVYFLQNSGVELRQSFQALRPQFESDQIMFLALHATTPPSSPMAVWHGNTQNWQDSIQMLSDFFNLSRSDKWTPQLWDCLKNIYYAKDIQTKQRLFSEIITPIFKSDELAQNIVRQTLLRQAYEKDSFLLDSHRYEIAHYFLAGKRMDDLLPMGTGNTQVIDYAIHIYTNLEEDSPQLYDSPALSEVMEQRGMSAPHTPPERIIAYLNCVIGEPLELVCSALMGKSSSTKGVVFEWTDDSLGRLDTLLRKIVSIKGKLLQKYGQKLPQIKVLEGIAAEIIEQMKTALEKQDEAQIVKMVRLSLKITVILEDDAYLEKILVTLRKDVFKLSDDPTLFQEFSQSEVDKKVRYFTILHSEDVVAALNSVGKMNYVLMFYRQLYQPLRNIYGFFNQVGAEPYIRFLKEFQSQTYDNRPDVNTLFKEELRAFEVIHDDQGRPRYINAETAIVDLVTAYCDRLNIDPWKNWEQFKPNVNLNLGTLYRLLSARTDANHKNWLLDNYNDQQRAERYREVGWVFLENIADAQMCQRPVKLYDPPAVYSSWEFYPFLLSLVDLYEIYAFPFQETRPTDLYKGDPNSGIRREMLAAQKQISPRKVDGSFRAKLFDSYDKVFFINDQSAAEQCDSLSEVVLLLPNQNSNNKRDQNDLQEYWELKNRAFNKTLELLKGASNSQQQLHWLVGLARLEASVYSLTGGEHPLGYAKVRSTYLQQLSVSDLKTLLFEEFLLNQVNQPSDKNTSDIAQLASVVQMLAEALCRDYPLISYKKYDSLAQAVLELYRQTDPENLLEELNEEHVKYLWFMTSKCGDALRDVAQRQATLSDEDKASAVSIASSVFFIHSFFAPYVHGKFNVDAIMKNDLRLFTFCLLDRKIKKPMAELMPLYEQIWSEHSANEWHFNMEPTQIKTFIICHNFLPVFLLEKSLDSPDLFVKLARGKDISLITYNFRLLWKREEKGKAGLDSICQEVLDGIDINKDFIASEMKWSDFMYLDYFFGDSRSLLGIAPEATHVPENFDALVSKLAVLAFDKRYKNILTALEQGIQQATDDETRKSLMNGRESAMRFPQSIRNALDNGYEYFGSILADKFSSPFTIQYACEKAWENVSQGQQRLGNKEALELYAKFYDSALFEHNMLKPDIEKNFVRTFYQPSQQSEQLSDYHLIKRKDFENVIDGTIIKGKKDGQELATKGLLAVMREDKSTAFGLKYKEASLHLLRGLFTGRYLQAGQPFIGDAVWGKDENGQQKLRPLPYTERQEDIHQLLEWVLSNGERYSEFPQLQNLFLDEKTK
jgi:hypothetical protein